jgi:hypothetical protein
MSDTTDVPNERQRDAIVASGELLLKMFHSSYEQNPTSVDTENLRGQFSCWKRMLLMLYNEAVAEEIILGVSEKAGLTIPPSGPLTPDGDGYIGWDSYCHMGPIGKLQGQRLSGADKPN